MARILFTCQDFKIGGHSSHALNLGEALRTRGHRVGIWVPEPFGELYPEFQKAYDRVLVQRRGLEPRAAYLKRVVNCISAFAPEVLINNAVPGIQAALPLLSPGLVRLGVVHSLHPRELQISLANREWLDALIAVADNIAWRLTRDELDGIPVVTLPVGLKVPPQPPRHSPGCGPLRLLYVGRIEPEKNLAGLLEILTDLAQSSTAFSITIVGAGRELEKIRSAVKSASYSKQVHFLGVLTPREIGKLMPSHDFLLLTSHYEGTPHAVLEAMAHGLVVLASRITGATDRIITHGVNGFLCDSRQPKDYANILRRFVNRPEVFAPISSAASETVRKRYGADTIAAGYEALFTSRPQRKRASEWEGGRSRRQLPPTLLPHFPGLLLQWKHRLADAWRRAVRGQKPVLLSSPPALA